MCVVRNFVNQENNPDDLPDLVAEILSHAVEVRQRRQLSLGYRRRGSCPEPGSGKD